MGHRNSLISGDNKGVASRFMEDWFERKDYGRMDSDVLGNDGSPQRISNIIPGLRDNHCDNFKFSTIIFVCNRHDLSWS
ncbi:neutral ceramidase [Trifolium repens]|nr:neutral ceramidase [Trifolium repens]